MNAPTADCRTDSPEAMERIGDRLASRMAGRLVVFLDGPLGAGKTTLVRGILRHFGYAGAVKSPTYTLVEPYDFGNQMVFHFDLYRLRDPEELEFIGMRDYLDGDGICLVEWAERARERLPHPDVEIAIEMTDSLRLVHIKGLTAAGLPVLGAVQ